MSPKETRASIYRTVSMLQGLLGTTDRERPFFRLPFTHLVVGTVLLPFTGLIVCLCISLLYHFEESTYTHCQVPNYLPSISAAIGYVPERYVWRCCIGMHSAPRYLFAAVYFNFYRCCFAKRLPELLLSCLALVCSVAENTGLLLLTYVSSTESYSVHKHSFIVFMGSSLLHMLVTCRLWHVIRSWSLNPEEVISYRWKRRLFLFNISCCLAAFYFFRRHNAYCEPGIYTFFALFEYLVVFSNMAFNMTAFWDFESQEVIVGTPPEDKRF